MVHDIVSVTDPHANVREATSRPRVAFWLGIVLVRLRTCSYSGVLNQSAALGLAGAASRCATFPRMPGPRAQLTAQDLTYAAQGARCLKLQAESDAQNPQMESCRAIFEKSAATYADLARKFDRIAAALSAFGVRLTWRCQQSTEPTVNRWMIRS
jgi:hypothetical protein